MYIQSASQRVESALQALRRGEGVLLVDSEDRENEGDIIFPAGTITAQQMALLIRHCSGIVCLCLKEEQIARLELPMMVTDNTSRYGTGFTVSIEAKRGVTTGVSAADRVTTIRTAIAQDASPSDLARPGHVFPLRAVPGGVLSRPGHTEGSIDLMELAGLTPAAVLCELMNDDGTMAKIPEIQAFSRLHSMPVVSIEDIIEVRRCEAESKEARSAA